MAYKHYLQNGEQGCLLRDWGGIYLYKENSVHCCQRCVDKEITGPAWGIQDSEQSRVTSLRDKPLAESQVI